MRDNYYFERVRRNAGVEEFCEIIKTKKMKPLFDTTRKKIGIILLTLTLISDITFLLKGDKVFSNNSNQTQVLYYIIGFNLTLQTLIFVHIAFPSFIQENKNWLKENKVSFFIYSALVAGCFLLFIDYKSKNLESYEFWNNVLVEAHGMFFDIILFGIILTIYERFNDRYNEIRRLSDEIDDFRYWKSDEAKFRIRGNLYRLNKARVTNLDLAFIDLSKIELRKINLSKATCCETDFSNSNMENSEFSNIECSLTKFNGKDTCLLNANFKNSTFQNTEFIEAYLVNADFTEAHLSNINFGKANLRGVNFQNVYLYKPNFEGAEVSSDFFEKNPLWNINGYSIREDYRIVKIPESGQADNFRYFLKKAT